MPNIAKRFLRMTSVVERVGLSKSHIYRLIRQGSFPKPVPLGQQSIAFLESEIDAWMHERIVARENEEGVAHRRKKARMSVAARDVHPLANREDRS